MKQALIALTSAVVLLFAACGGQKPAAAPETDTTAVRCDSAARANCCPGDSTAGCGGCVAPAAPADTADDASQPCPSGG